VTTSSETLPDDVGALKAALLAERAARREFEARASGAEAMVAHLKLLIAKLKRDRFGASAERGRKLLDQLEMQLEELETAAAEDEAAAAHAAPDKTTVRPFMRAKPVRAPLPAHLSRERVVLPSPTSCPCCGGKLAKLGETITETLESIPRSYKVIQTVREKFSCRCCETITQPPAPFHVIARGRAGPDLLATIMHGKFGEHQPLNRQSERFACEGIDLSVSYSRDRGGEHPCRHLAGYAGILQADAYAGFNDLYHPARTPGPITEAACWAHGRRKLFVLADVAKAPLAIEAVRRIDAIFDVERDINGLPATQRHAMRQLRVAPLITSLETWMRGERSRLSRHADVAKAMDYMLKRWDAFTRLLDDGRICLTNNAAERTLRGIALGRKSWLFAGSDRGGERASAMYSLIATAKLNEVDPRAWLADVLARIADHPASRLDELLPWHWPRRSEDRSLAA
jgi:transposase